MADTLQARAVPSALNESERLALDRQRLDRIIAAIAYASTGDYQEALDALSVPQSDGFGVIEEALRVFLEEFITIKRQHADSLRKLTASNLALEHRLTTIEQQRLTIRELSAPIIEVWNEVVAIVLIGPIDEGRATDIMTKLLTRLSQSHARWVILDLTGVDVVDSTTAGHLVQLAKAARLSGAKCVVTGIGPHIARTLVALNLSLEDLVPLQTLQQGLRYCLRNQLEQGDR